MLNKKHKELLNFLLKQNGEWTTSNKLALSFNVTSRTIRNRVAKINEEIPDLIESSNLGYAINRENYEMLIKNTETDYSNNSSRDPLILLELLKNSKNGINLFDLSEKLYIAESTLNNDLQRLRNNLSSNNLQISVKNNIIKLEGAERFKRQYMVTLLYNEGDMQDELSETIQKMIGYISLRYLRKAIKTVLDNHNIIANHYALDNTVLHFAVSIERISQGYILSEDEENTKLTINLKKELDITKEIVAQLSKKYNLKFPDTEVFQLSLQFVGLQDKSVSYNDRTNIEDYINENIIDVLRVVLSRTEKIYLIDFSDQEFFNKLAVHLQSLHYRSKFKTYTRNSSIMDIKINYPITYDVSVYISSLIQEKLDIQFNEDEIAFIALHVGTLLEKQKTNEKNIKLLLFVNDYHNISNQLKESIEKALNSNVTIFSINSIEELEYRQYDLLVTTNRDIATQFDDSVFIKPFLTERDVNVLRKRVENKKRVHKKAAYNLLIEKYFNPKLFFNKLDTLEMDVPDVLDRMVEELIDQDYVDDSFYISIQKREGMSSTSFPSCIAIPHSVELDAIKSGISILTLQEPIKWADYKVTMVAMVAINKKEAKTFNKLFEIFTEIVSDKHNVERLASAENFEEFLMHLKLMIALLI
ncbi:transcription antiterminator [Carnobacterium sp. CS13]|uniref:BglG family transcription antiterminator n=1 Tax=Carnobacterium sp. CS13 TaxID=2800128 RepID=UPI00191238E4|nr:PRD domain-containing protein [Carnobacterium sp. CS13]QQP69521.1 transcription antiterminator [Carnobacterium sp. CS13]